MTKLSSMWDAQARVSLGKGPSDAAAGKRLESSCVDLCTKIFGAHILAGILWTPATQGGVVEGSPAMCSGSLTRTSPWMQVVHCVKTDYDTILCDPNMMLRGSFLDPQS